MKALAAPLCALTLNACVDMASAAVEMALLPVTVTEMALGTNVRESVETAIDRQIDPEKYALEDAEAAGTEEALVAFIETYPESEYRPDAERRLEALRAENQKQRDEALLVAIEAADIATVRRLFQDGATVAGAERLRQLRDLKNGVPTLNLHTPLIHRVAASGDPALMAVLLASGADPDLTDPIGDTALHIAMRHDRADMVETLRQGGADPDKLNPSGLLYWEMAPMREVDVLIDKAVVLIDAETGDWDDERTGLRLYGALRDKPNRHAVYGLVRKVADTPEQRVETLLLAIKLGLPDSARQLNDLLMRAGDVSMAEDFINSGSSELSSGGYAWADAHNYNVTYYGSGSSRSHWGKF